jgi:hypothetical protein
MNTVKKFLGFIWLVLGPAVVIFLVMRAGTEFAAANKLPAADAAKKITELNVFWPIIIGIFTPIMAGLSLFGWYGVKDEYDHDVTSSADL